MKLSTTEEKYILHWGEMGTRWGVNRTVAQIHALLYIRATPLAAEEIADTLGVARSNVSTSLKELKNWELIKVVHVLGDRRDHFAAQQDIWEIFRTVVEQRKRREIDPTLTMLRECVLNAENDSELPKQALENLHQQLEFLQVLSEWYEEMHDLDQEKLIRLFRMGKKLRSLLRV